MLAAAVKGTGPVAIRYPRGGQGEYAEGGCEMSRILREGSDVTLVCYGVLVNNVLKAAELLAAEGISAEIIKLGTVKPIDYSALEISAKKTGHIVVVEECVRNGAVGEAVAAKFAEDKINANAMLINLGDEFVPHGTPDELREVYSLDAKSIAEKVADAIKGDR